MAKHAPIPHVAGDSSWGRAVASAKETDPAADQKSACRPRATSYPKLIQPPRSDPCT